MQDKSGLTAIHRRGASAPCRWLADHDKLVGPVLDWGCGYGADVRFIRNAYGYDPHHQPDPPEDGELFNTVLCTYVLNVLKNYHDRCLVICDILPYMAPGAWLYVSIRSDKAKLQGHTKRGTWQGYVGDQLRTGGFTLIRGVANYEIWGWQKSWPK